MMNEISKADSLLKRYSKQGLWSLYLMCAFPLHAWTMILAFRDFSWVSERTNSWDAVGVVSYGLIFAFIESVIIFLVMVLLGFLVSRKWAEARRIALLSTLVILASLWAMAGYAYFLFEVKLSGRSIEFIAHLEHPLRFLYAVSLALVGGTFLLPTYGVLRSDRFLKGIQGLYERLSLLTLFYLFFDVVGLIIVIARNI
jgi:hypothetical protein